MECRLRIDTVLLISDSDEENGVDGLVGLVGLVGLLGLVGPVDPVAG